MEGRQGTCRVQGAGCRVQGAGCRVQGAGCRVQGAGGRVCLRGRPTGDLPTRDGSSTPAYLSSVCDSAFWVYGEQGYLAHKIPPPKRAGPLGFRSPPILGGCVIKVAPHEALKSIA